MHLMTEAHNNSYVQNNLNPSASARGHQISYDQHQFANNSNNPAPETSFANDDNQRLQYQSALIEQQAQPRNSSNPSDPFCNLAADSLRPPTPISAGSTSQPSTVIEQEEVQAASFQAEPGPSARQTDDSQPFCFSQPLPVVAKTPDEHLDCAILSTKASNNQPSPDASIATHNNNNTSLTNMNIQPTSYTKNHLINNGGNISANDELSIRRRREDLSRRPSYRKIFNDLTGLAGSLEPPTPVNASNGSMMINVAQLAPPVAQSRQSPQLQQQQQQQQQQRQQQQSVASNSSNSNQSVVGPPSTTGSSPSPQALDLLSSVGVSAASVATEANLQDLSQASQSPPVSVIDLQTNPADVASQLAQRQQQQQHVTAVHHRHLTQQGGGGGGGPAGSDQLHQQQQHHHQQHPHNHHHQQQQPAPHHLHQQQHLHQPTHISHPHHQHHHHHQPQQQHPTHHHQQQQQQQSMQHSQAVSQQHPQLQQQQQHQLLAADSPPITGNMMGGGGGGEEANKKRELRLQKNREAAKECRRKKKEYIKCLENRVAVLENQNKALIEELKTLKDLYCKTANE